MFNEKNNDEPSELDEAISSVFSDLRGFTSDDEEYAKSVDQLVKLYNLKDIDRPKRVSPDTLLLVSSNLLGILMIVGHERGNVITSKALSFVKQLR